MRARNTSPALMCRSDAPRSTAALMIFSISVPGLLVDEVPQRFSSHVSAPIVEKKIELTGPKTTRRHGRYVRREQHISTAATAGLPAAVAPPGRRRARRRAGDPPASRSTNAISSIIAPRATFTTIALSGSKSRRAAVRSPDVSRVRGAASTITSWIGSSRVELVERNHALETGGRAQARRADGRRCNVHRAQLRRWAVAPPRPPTPMISARTVSISRSTESTRTNGVLFHSRSRC